MMKLTFCLAFIILYFSFDSVKATPLDDYVNKPDPYYKYELIKTYEMTGYSLYILNLTSQKWLDETISDRSIWWHYVSVSIPTKVTKPDIGFMFIEGGDNNSPPPAPTENFVQLTSAFAASTGAIGVNLQQIPNQPIVFKKDPQQKSRHEDGVIAWTWKEFMDNTSNPYILLRMPMTKAAVKAMDAVTDFVSKKVNVNIKKFMVAGASKRGWTTWTTAAVDNNRVIAAIPIVMDLLNMNTNMHHHYKSLGGWTFAFNDYRELNITQMMDTPELFALQELVDPFYYLDRYTNTQLYVVNSAGDEFFIPDDYDYFWQNLVTATGGSVLNRRLPNAEHSCGGHEISLFFSMRSLFLSVYNNQKLPQVKWFRPNNITHGITSVVVDIVHGPIPINATVFYAQTLDSKRRDFRLLIADPQNPGKVIPHPVLWKPETKSIQIQQTSTSIIYTIAFPKPFSGWLGFFFQLTFPGLEDTVLQVSSEVNIIPESFPFPDCYKESCLGTLV